MDDGLDVRTSPVMQLELDRGFRKASLHRMFPDQKELLQKLASSKVWTVKALLERLQYTGPIEVLTMHLCLILSRSVYRWKPQQGLCPKLCWELRSLGVR